MPKASFPGSTSYPHQAERDPAALKAAARIGTPTIYGPMPVAWRAASRPVSAMQRSNPRSGLSLMVFEWGTDSSEAM
ncbi:MAG: hypothetical protein WA633_04925 [Stellaceae bacterium]